MRPMANTTDLDRAAGPVFPTAAGSVLEALAFAWADNFPWTFAARFDPAAGYDFIQFVPLRFAAGTHIAAAEGEVRVEDLRLGDLVVTLAGRGAPLQPVRRIRELRVDVDGHPNPATVRPVRIAAGAFGAGWPLRDLFVAPDQALVVDGEPISPGMLLNGITVAPALDCAEVRYVEIALDRPAVLIAEGVPAACYRDGETRDLTSSVPSMLSLHPELALHRQRTPGASSAGRGTVPAAVRRQLIAGVVPPGYMIGDDPVPALLVDGRRLAAFSVEGGTHRFALPHPVREVRLLSRAGAPGAAGAEAGRRVGLCVAAITLRTADGQARAIALDHAAFREGFVPVQRVGRARCRWTKYASWARLPADLLDGGIGATLELHLLWPAAS